MKITSKLTLATAMLLCANVAYAQEVQKVRGNKTCPEAV